jgi:N-acetylneuraminate synthase
MTLDLDEPAFMANPDGPWAGRKLIELYREAATPMEWHEPIFSRCRDLGMIPFSTPFDVAGVEFLERLGVPCYKIASFENGHLPLIRKAARTGKPLIISTGMATQEELQEAVAAAREVGCRDLVLLKCTSSYPASPENSNLRTLPDMRERFGCEVGLSDHTLGVGAAVAAVAMGATVIEKHFTLCRADGGVDASFSLEPEEFRQLVVETERAWQALGKVCYEPTVEEMKARERRRSLYAVRDIKAGEAFTTDNIRAIRPGAGLAPKHWETVLERRAARDIRRGTPLSWDLLAE